MSLIQLDHDEMRLEMFTFAEFKGNHPVGRIPNTRIILCRGTSSSPIIPVRSEDERHILQTNLKVFLPRPPNTLSPDEVRIIQTYFESHSFALDHHVHDRLIFHCKELKNELKKELKKELKDYKELKDFKEFKEYNKLKEYKKGSKGVVMCRRRNNMVGDGWAADGGWSPRSDVRDIDCLRCNERGLSYLPFSCCDRSLSHLGPLRFVRLSTMLHPTIQTLNISCEKCRTLFRQISLVSKSPTTSPCQQLSTLFASMAVMPLLATIHRKKNKR
jgi:hypothetical protein